MRRRGTEETTAERADTGRCRLGTCISREGIYKVCDMRLPIPVPLSWLVGAGVAISAAVVVLS